MTLRILDHLPEGLLERQARDLADVLGGPTLIRLSGAREPALLVSVLLHGNEDSGWNGLRRLLTDLGTLPRSLILFIGNVEAAAASLRVLPHQQDFNRIWPDAPGPEGALARAVIEELAGVPLHAAIDLHNNTGHNPHYAVVTDLSPRNLGLAYLFSDKAVYVREPATVMTRVFAGRCPAVALELGPVGDPRCDDRAYDLVHRCLVQDGIPDADLEGLQLFRTQVRVHVTDAAEFSFAGDGTETPLVLTGGVESVNFHLLPAGTEFGAATAPLPGLLRVLDVEHNDVTERYFELRDGRILLKQAVVPAMYTLDPMVIRQDCLCYFMERLPLAP
jgi:succinylglutamate desuccinylase